MADILVTVSDLAVFAKGERKKEIQIGAAFNTADSSEPVLVESQIWRGLKGDAPVPVGGVGFPIFRGDPGESFSLAVMIIEKDDDKKPLSDLLQRTLDNPVVDNATSLIPGFEIISNLVAGIPALIAKDDVLVDYAHYAVEPPNVEGADPTEYGWLGDYEVRNDRAKFTLKIRSMEDGV